LTGTTTFSYGSYGQIANETYHNNATVDYEYDTMRRVKTIKNWDSNANTIYDLSNISRNAAGMITSITGSRELNGGESDVRSYSYDNVYRLTSQNDVVINVAPNQTRWAYNYQYDLAGNRTFGNNGNEFNYNDFNQLSSADMTLGGIPGIFKFDYDLNGNLNVVSDELENPIREYLHNRENRLVELYAPTGEYQKYHYDSAGRLLLQHTEDFPRKKYYYDGINLLMVKTAREYENYGGCYRTE